MLSQLTNQSMPIDSFKIAIASDVENIVSLVNNAYRPDNQTTVGWTHEAHLISGARIDASKVISLITQADSLILLGIQQHRIISCVHLNKKEQQVNLGMLAVDPRVQQHGLGKQMLSYAETYAYEVFGAEKCTMQVLQARTELIDFYLRRGYQKLAQILDYPLSADVGIPLQADLKIVFMEKPLGKDYPQNATRNMELL